MINRFGFVLSGLMLSGFLFASHVNAQQAASSATLSSTASSDEWKFSVTPYAWAMGIRGSVASGDRRVGKVGLSPGDVLSDLKMAGMVVAEAKRGRYGLYLDGVYGDLGSTSSRPVDRVDLKAKTSIQMTMLTIAPNYNLYKSQSFSIDGLAGARILWQGARTTLTIPEINQSISATANMHVATGIAGVKGRWNLGDSKYFVPFYVDVGAGQSSSFTTQAYLGIGHEYSWGDVSLVAKNVYYQFKANDNNVSLNMFGAAIAATFRF